MNKGIQMLIVAIVLIVAGMIYITFSSKSGPSMPAPKITVPKQPVTLQPPTPQATTSSTISIQPSTDQTQTCLKDDLSAKAMFDAAAGNVYGTFTIKNTSSHTCIVPLNNYLTLNYDKLVKNLEVKYPVAGAGTMAKPYILKPGSSLKAQIHYPNGPQCQGQVKEIAITYTFMTSPKDSVIFSDEIGKTEMAINVCENSSDITTVDVTAFAP